MKRLLLLFISIIALLGLSGCASKEQISYDFDTYLSCNTSFEKNYKLVMPSKDKLNDATVLYYVYYDSKNTVTQPDRMIQMTVKYSDELFVSEKQGLEEKIIEPDASFETEEFYFNGSLYQGSLFYNVEANNDEFEDTYNDGYFAFAYNVCTTSNTISYLVFESEDLQYMDMQSALTLFPQFEGNYQVVSAGNLGNN